MRVLVVSGRATPNGLADACAYDFEDAIVDALDADLLTSAADRMSLAQSYDLMIVCGIGLPDISSIMESCAARTDLPSAGRKLAYVFGAYGAVSNRPRNPLKRLGPDFRRVYRTFDRAYLGIENDVAKISSDLDVATRYLPMAANLLAVDAKPCRSSADRPIAVAAVGRQHVPIMNAISDRLNRPDSEELVYRTNFMEYGRVTDLPRYRAMLWQVLRKSRLTTSFDHFHANEGGRARHSYVGPRWFESLAAGTVVVGRGPQSPDAARLIGWRDATIELSDDPTVAADEIEGLLADNDRLCAASTRNLVEMARRHDWGHRLAEMLSHEGIDMPEGLKARLEALQDRASRFAAAGVS